MHGQEAVTKLIRTLLYVHISGGTARAEISGRELSVTLEDVLQFVTGSRGIPAEGFETQPSIVFEHATHNRYPSANTCRCTLTLPVCDIMKDEEISAEVFIHSIFGGQMFGLV